MTFSSILVKTIISQKGCLIEPGQSTQSRQQRARFGGMRKLKVFLWGFKGEIIDIYEAKRMPRRSTSLTIIISLEEITFNNNHFTLGTFRFLPRRCGVAARSLHPTTGELQSPRGCHNPTPAIPPYVVRTPHLHGAPTTEETTQGGRAKPGRAGPNRAGTVIELMQNAGGQQNPF